MSVPGARRDDFILGLTALLLIALLVGTILFLNPGIEGATRRLSVYFPHREGLAPIKKGSPVVLGGVLTVGKVADVRSAEMEMTGPGGRALKDANGAPVRELVIVVDADVQRDLPLHDDCMITSDQPPVGGNGLLAIIDAGTPSRPLLGDGAIRGLPPQSLAAAISTLSRRLLGPDGVLASIEGMLDAGAEGSLAFKLSKSLSDINDLTGALRNEFEPRESAALLAKVHRIMDDVNAMTTALRQEVASGDKANLTARIHQLLDHLDEGLIQVRDLAAENRPAISRMTTSLASAAEQIDQGLLAKLRAEFDRDAPASLLGKLHLGMTRLNNSLGDIAEISANGRQLLVQNRPALDRSISNLREMSEQLRLTSQELRAAPWRLLYQPSAAETKEMSLFDAARTFAEAATYLDDAAARLQAVTEAAPQTGAAATNAEALKIMEGIRAAFDRFQRAETFLYEKMR